MAHLQLTILSHVLIGSCLSVGVLASDVTDWQGLKPEAQKGWVRLKSAVQEAGLEGSFSLVTRLRVSGHPEEMTTRDMKFARAENAVLVTKVEDGAEKVRAINGDYAFDAGRGQSAGGNYELGTLRRKEPRTEMAQEADMFWQPYVCAGYSFLGIDLAVLVDRPDVFVIDSVNYDEASSLITLSFHVGSDLPADLVEKTRSWVVKPEKGEITLDSTKDFAPVRVRGSYGDIDWVYDVTVMPFEKSYVPKTIAFEFSHRVSGAWRGETFELKEIKRISQKALIPVALKDYGLEEPVVGVDNSAGVHNSGWWLLLLNVGGLCLIVIVFYLRRRKAAVDQGRRSL